MAMAVDGRCAKAAAAHEIRQSKLRARLIKFLTKSQAEATPTSDGKRVILKREDERVLTLDTPSLRAWISQGLIEQTGGQADSVVRVKLASIDLSMIKQKPDLRDAPLEDAPRDDNSPLARIYFARAGQSAWLSKAQYHAGERLRTDFEHAQLSPRLGLDWSSIGMPKQAKGNGHRDNTSDFAADARARVAKAMIAVGPEMADVLLDVCCFLKGLEVVERERNWPRRSAKLALRFALCALDRHYNPPPATRSRKVRHWGAQDYRPDL
ncbi:MAG: DUF6456 domain-containing protein [Pseudomonadota bacterium]